MYNEIPSHFQAAIDALLREGRLIDAIKLYREETGADLKSSKDVIEARREQLESAQTGSLSAGPASEMRFGLDSTDFQSKPSADDHMREAEEYIRQGKKIHAIKAYRMATGEGLKEAKKAVERMAGDTLKGEPERLQAFEQSDGGALGFVILLVVVVGLVLLGMLLF